MACTFAIFATKYTLHESELTADGRVYADTCEPVAVPENERVRVLRTKISALATFIHDDRVFVLERERTLFWFHRCYPFRLRS
jgi:hypothetical protein